MLSLLTLLVSLLTLNLWGCGPEEPSDAGPMLAAEPIEQPLIETSPATHVQPTGWRGSTGRLGTCPVLWLTQHYAVTAAHCAVRNGGVTAEDFDANNIATVPGSMVGRVQNSYGVYTSTMTAKVMAHPGFDVDDPCEGECTNAEYAADFAVYYVTSGAWTNWALHGKNRARTYETQTPVFSCSIPQTTYGKIGASGTIPQQQTERCDDDRYFCWEIGFTNSAHPAIDFAYAGLGSNNEQAAPDPERCLVENGDSGFASYLTTNDYDRPVYIGILVAGDSSATVINNLRPQVSFIKSADTMMGGPAISSYLYTEDLGGGVTVTYRLYTDAAE